MIYLRKSVLWLALLAIAVVGVAAISVSTAPRASAEMCVEGTRDCGNPAWECGLTPVATLADVGVPGHHPIELRRSGTCDTIWGRSVDAIPGEGYNGNNFYARTAWDNGARIVRDTHGHHLWDLQNGQVTVQLTQAKTPAATCGYAKQKWFCTDWVLR